MEPYSTHIEALTIAALNTPGDILELGCGHYSTPILAAIAKHRGDRFSIKSSSEEWSTQFKRVADVEIVDWDTWVPEGNWGLVMLDNEQLTRDRILWLPKLQKICKTIVMHDADASMSHPNYGEMISGFAGMELYAKHTPWTAIFTC